MREKTIENRLRENIKARGGVAFKFTSPGTDGVPDRLVCLPDNRMYLVELKSPVGQLSFVQTIVHTCLKKMGIMVYVINSVEQLTEFLNMIDAL